MFFLFLSIAWEQDVLRLLHLLWNLSHPLHVHFLQIALGKKGTKAMASLKRKKMSSCQVSAPHLPVQQNQTCPSYPHVRAGQVLKEDNGTFKRFFLGIKTKKGKTSWQTCRMFLCESFIKVCSNSEQPHLCPGLFEAIWVILHTIFTEPMTSTILRRESSPEHVHTVFLCNRIMHEKKNPSLCVIHTVQNLYKDSIIQIYLLHFSLFFLLWNTKTGSFEKETNIMVHMWLAYLLLHEIHL